MISGPPVAASRATPDGCAQNSSHGSAPPSMESSMSLNPPYELRDGLRGTGISWAGGVLETRHSRAFLADLAGLRPGLDLVDELLRSEHPPYLESRLRVALEPHPDRGTWRGLDFGCGPGASSVVLARLGMTRIVGLDLVNEYA